MPLTDRKIRVAFVVGEYPPAERKRREDTALAYSSPEVEVGIVSVKASPHYIGNAPDLLGLAVPPFIDAFRDAEKRATTPWCPWAPWTWASMQVVAWSIFRWLARASRCCTSRPCSAGASA